MNKKDIALNAIAVGGLGIVAVLGCSAVQGSPLETVLLPVVCLSGMVGAVCILGKSSK